MKRKLSLILLALLMALALSPAASAAAGYVTDDAGLLTAGEIASLETTAQSIAQRYGVGIYIVTVDDYYTIDSRGAYEAAYTFYHGRSLGVGTERNGAILLLSMYERDFAHFYYGEKSEYAFNAYGQAEIEDVFLDNFRENDWYGGFSDYLTACGEYLAQAAEGHPVRRSAAVPVAVCCAASVLIAFIVCAALKAKMKSVYTQGRADGYAGTLHLTRQTDRFTHRTETRRKIEPPKSSGGGGGSVAHTGGGGSGRSGKF